MEGYAASGPVTLSYETFKANPGMFCLNKGRSFHNGLYDQGIHYEIKGGEIVVDEYWGTEDETVYREYIKDDVDFMATHFHAASYILSSIPEEGARAVDYWDDPNQIAIWLLGDDHKLTAGSGSNARNASEETFRAAVKIIANAKAYEQFVQTQSQIGMEPSVITTDARTRVIGNRTFVGPFVINYGTGFVDNNREYATVDGNREVEWTEDGFYGEITNMTFRNTTIGQNQTYDAFGNLLTGDDVFQGYPNSGKEFYILSGGAYVGFGENGQPVRDTLKVEMNNNYVEAEYDIMTASKSALTADLEDFQNIIGGGGRRIPSEGEAPVVGEGFKRDSQTREGITGPKLEKVCVGGVTSVTEQSNGVLYLNWNIDKGWTATANDPSEITYSGCSYNNVRKRTWTQTGHQDATITITETEAPLGYKKIMGAITIKVQRWGTRTITDTSTRTCNISHNPYSHTHDEWSELPDRTNDTAETTGYNPWGNFYDPAVLESKGERPLVLNEEFEDGDVELVNEEDWKYIEVGLYDIPTVTFGGNVWLDQADEGLKYNNPADGQMGDGELKIEGVRVKLYTTAPIDGVTPWSARQSGNGTLIYGNPDSQGGGVQVLNDLYGNSLENIKTDSEGRYYFSEGDHQSWGVEKDANYYVKFEFDGVNYDVVRDASGNEIIGQIGDLKANHASESMYNRSRI